MPVPYYGDYPEDHTHILIPFNTFTSDDPSASCTITDLADADIYVHKDGSTDEIVTDGATVAINFDGITGNHLITIDSSADAAYSTGSEYTVRIEGTTIDGATINAWVGAFSIERSGGVLALIKGGAVKVDVDTIKTQAVTCGAGVTIRADVGAAAAPGAANGMFIGGANAATTVASFSCTGQLDAGSVVVDAGMDIVGALSANSLLIDTTTTLTGNVALNGTLGVAGATTLASLSITNQLDAGNLLVDGTTVLTGTVGTGALTAASVSVTGQLDAGNVLVDGTTVLTGTTTLTGNVMMSNGLSISNATGDGHGVAISGNGSGDGIFVIAGDTGHGIETRGGGTSGCGIFAEAATEGDGIYALGKGTDEHGILAVGGDTTGDGIHAEAATEGDGIYALGKGTAEHGILAVGGDVSGDGIHANATAGNGNGMSLVKHGTGVDLDADITGDITGSLSGSVASVTGNVDGDVSGNVDGTVAGVTPATAANVNTQVLDVLNTDTFAEPGDEIPTSTTTLVDKIGYLYKFMRNKIETTATKINVYNDAGDNIDHTSTISDDDTTFTRGEFGAGE